MKLVCVFSFLLLLSGLSSIASQEDAFDHFWLVLTWPPTFCLQNAGTINACNRNANAQFTIHGLWPANARGYTLYYTVQENADLSWFTDTRLRLVGDLTQYWPSLGGLTDEEFWHYEWLKHGSKQGDFAPKVYFQKAVSIRKRAGNIVTALANKGVIPDNVRGYSSTQFVNALIRVTRTDQVMLTCSSNALIELRICVNRDATEFIPCNANEMSQASCARMPQFIFPPISSLSGVPGGGISGGGIESLDRSMFKLLCICITIVIELVSRQDWLLLL